MIYKAITQEELNEKLELHKQWLDARKNYNYAGKRLVLKDCDLSGLHLKRVRLVMAELEHVRFSGDLEGACFDKATLKNVDFKTANLKRASFACENMELVNFWMADLESAQFNCKKITECNFTSANLKHASFYGPVANRNIW